MSISKSQAVHAVQFLYYLGAGLHLYHVDYSVVALCYLLLSADHEH